MCNLCVCGAVIVLIGLTFNKEISSSSSSRAVCDTVLWSSSKSCLPGFSSRWWVLFLTSSVYPKIRNSNLRWPSSRLLQTIAAVLWWAAGGKINPLNQQSSTISSELVKRRQQNRRLQASKTDPAWCSGETLIFLTAWFHTQLVFIWHWAASAAAVLSIIFIQTHSGWLRGSAGCQQVMKHVTN